MARAYLSQPSSRSSDDSEEEYPSFNYPSRTRHPAQTSISNENYDTEMSTTSFSPSAPPLSSLQPHPHRKAPALPTETNQQARDRLKVVHSTPAAYPKPTPRTTLTHRRANSLPAVLSSHRDKLIHTNTHRSISPILENSDDEMSTQTSNPGDDTELNQIPHYPDTQNVLLQNVETRLLNPSFINLECDIKTVYAPQISLEIMSYKDDLDPNADKVLDKYVRKLYVPYLSSNSHSYIQRSFYQRLFPHKPTFLMRLGKLGRNSRQQPYQIAICRLDFQVETLSGEIVPFSETLFILEHDPTASPLVFGRTLFTSEFQSKKSSDHGMALYTSMDPRTGYFIRYVKPQSKIGRPKMDYSPEPKVKQNVSVGKHKHDLRVFIPSKPVSHFGLPSSTESPLDKPLLSPESLIASRQRSQSVTTTIYPTARPKKGLKQKNLTSTPRDETDIHPRSGSPPFTQSRFCSPPSTRARSSSPTLLRADTLPFTQLAPVHNKLSLSKRKKAVKKTQSLNPKLNFFSIFNPATQPKSPTYTDLREQTQCSSRIDRNDLNKQNGDESRHKFSHRNTEFAISKPRVIEQNKSFTPVTESSSLSSAELPCSQKTQGFGSNSSDNFDLHYWDEPPRMCFETPSPCVWCLTTFTSMRQKMWHIPQCANNRVT